MTASQSCRWNCQHNYSSTDSKPGWTTGKASDFPPRPPLGQTRSPWLMRAWGSRSARSYTRDSLICMEGCAPWDGGAAKRKRERKAHISSRACDDKMRWHLAFRSGQALLCNERILCLTREREVYIRETPDPQGPLHPTCSFQILLGKAMPKLAGS